MLLNIKKDPKAGEVIAVKLVSGEELLGRLVSSTDTEFVLDRPVRLRLLQTPTGAQVTFEPFMVGTELDVEFTIAYEKTLVRPVVARDDAAKQYLQSTTNIAL